MDEFLKRCVSPSLASAGFTKRGLVWRRSRPYGFQVIEVQRNRMRGDGSVPFTIEVGLFVSDLWEIVQGRDYSDAVKAVDCHPRFRLGYLMGGWNPKILERWWTIEPEGKACNGCSEISDCLRDQLVPLLDSLNSAKDVFEFSELRLKPRIPLEKIERVVLAGICGHLNEGDFEPLLQSDYWGEFAAKALQRLRAVLASPDS